MIADLATAVAAALVAYGLYEAVRWTYGHARAVIRLRRQRRKSRG